MLKLTGAHGNDMNQSDDNTDMTAKYRKKNCIGLM